MLPPPRVDHSERVLPHLESWWHDYDYEVLPRHADLFRGLLDQGLPVPAGRQDPLVVHDHELLPGQSDLLGGLLD